MLELIVLLTIVTFVSTYFFLPMGGSLPLLAKDEKPSDKSAPILEEGLLKDSILRNQFLIQLQHEVEMTLFPKPTDSVLKRHYDALVAAELEDRLAKMPI